MAFPTHDLPMRNFIHHLSRYNVEASWPMTHGGKESANHLEEGTNYVQDFSVYRKSRSTPRSQSKWLIWCILQRRPHLSFGASESFLCLQHCHCPAFIEIQAVSILLQNEALGDNLMKPGQPCQSTKWLHAGFKSDHSWHLQLCKESNISRAAVWLPLMLSISLTARAPRPETLLLAQVRHQ